MKIKAKIFWTLLSMSSLVAFVGALAVNRQHVVATVGAIKEAEDIARALGLLLSNGFSSDDQEMIANLHKMEGRDVVLVDINKLVLADAVPSDIGKKFTEDPGDEVGATLKDGQARTFIEISSDSPRPIKQIAVPAQDYSGHVIGAVILEYTPLYDELMQSTRATTRQVILGGLLSVVIAFVIASFIGRSVVVPLQQLRDVATAFASGKVEVPMPPPRRDEIGELANAFDNMVQKRRQAEEELRHARDELEIRVTERTAELAKSNEALQVENAERKRAEETSRESEERFRQIAENINEVFWLSDPQNTQTIYVSPAYEKVWGRSRDSLYATPKSWIDAIHPEDKERVAASMAKKSIKAHHNTYRIVRPDGSIRWIRDRGFPVRDASGVVVRFAGIAEDITESKQAEDALNIANRQLQILSRHRVQVQEDERRHLARELHDQIGQVLTATKISIQAAKRSKKRETMTRQLNDAMGVLDQILLQVRQMTFDLRPPALDDLGLVPALRLVLDDFARRATWQVQFSGDANLERPDAEVETACFRIALEALTNALRHAKAHTVSLESRKMGESLHLVVRDDGVGFDTAEAKKRIQRDQLGLLGMRERAIAVGGSFECRSAPGKGTEVHAFLPFHPT